MGIIGEAAVNTPLLALLPSQNQTQGDQYIYQIQEPIDVAQQLLWLASRQASFMNGEVVILDGGVTITSSNYQEYVK